MNQCVPEYGLTLLELCKTAIHRSVNNRRKSIPKPTDTNNTKFNHKYLLVTSSCITPIQCGWDNSTDYFLKSIESLQANDKPNFGKSLSTAFRLIQSNPNQILSYGQGWKSWQNEMNVIIILSYCINTTYSSSINILNLNKRNLCGDELESDWIRWNTRIFVGNINVFGTLRIDDNNNVNKNALRDALNNLCIETSPSDHNHVINNELHSLSQIERWVTAIMRDNSRDGLMVEFWDSSKHETIEENGGDETKLNNKLNNKLIKFNDGHIFREFIIPIHHSGKWPIPESYSPKEQTERNKSSKSHLLPPRRCRPQIAISKTPKNAPCLPRSEWNVPYEQYEITSPRFKDFLCNLPSNISYYAYIQHSAGTKFNFAKPWGALKGDIKRNKAFLYVFVYDFPFVWNQISVFLQAAKRNFHNFSQDEWKRAVGAYLNFIPSYYIQSVQELLMQTTKGTHLPSFPSSIGLDPSITSYLNEIQRKWRGNNQYKVKEDNDGDIIMNHNHDKQINNNHDSDDDEDDDVDVD